MPSPDLGLLLGVFDRGELPEQCQSCRFIRMSMNGYDETNEPVSHCRCDLWRLPVTEAMKLFWENDFSCKVYLMRKTYKAIVHFETKRKSWWDRVKDVIAVGDLVWFLTIEEKRMKSKRKNVIFRNVSA